MIQKTFHIDSIEYLITSTYLEGKGYWFNTFFVKWTMRKNFITFTLRKKDWDIISTQIKYYYKFVNKT